MKQFLITVAGVLVALLLFLFIGPAILFLMLAPKAPAQPSHMVLALDLRSVMPDQPPTNPLASFASSPSLLDTLTRIDEAAHDGRVSGIYVRANTDGMSAAQAEEIRAALKAFRDEGKFVVAHLQNDGVRMSMAGYTAIADSDEVWLQGVGEFMPMGITSEVTFWGGTLARYHMQAQFEAREEYKTYANEYTQAAFTAAHRQETQEMMQSLYDNMLADIAADRGMNVQQAKAAIEATPFDGARAMALHLVDHLGRPEEAQAAALDRANEENAEVVDFADYQARPHSGGRVIAVVQGEGEIVSGPDSVSLLSNGSNMVSDTIAQALLDASNDNDVAAIIFRVSSPGGSVVASDQILAALRTARQHGKKVIVSMGEVAASGGYYISADADEIIASPSTLTGSIGVVGGKLIIGGALEHYLSANTETISVGSPMTGMFSPSRPFSPAERAAFAGFIDRSYADFIGLVAAGRHLTPEQAHDAAHGRVWTGAQALQRHLVDRLGGYSVAIARAKELAGIPADTRVQLRYYPVQRNPFASLGRLFGVSGEAMEGLVRLNAALSDPRVQEALAAVREDDANVRAEAGRITVR